MTSIKLSLTSGARAITNLSDSSPISLNNVTIEIKRVYPSSEDWDAFALRCDTSYRGLCRWIKLREISSQLFGSIQYYSFFIHQGVDWIKIGQCAIGVTLRCRRFADGLQLLPQYRDVWSACLQAVVNELGPGLYIYGSDWSTEPPREDDIASLLGLSVISVEWHVVEGVDFARWTTWDEYERSISSNVRRNIKRAQATLGPVHIEQKFGASALLLEYDLLKCKAAMYRRKALPPSKLISSHMIRLLALPKFCYVALLKSNKRTLAAFGGIEAGVKAYYFDGGSMSTDGAGWVLNMSLMQDFYARHPTGRFLMGTVPMRVKSVARWESPFRYRRDCRVSAFLTSIVTFAYRGV